MPSISYAITACNEHAELDRLLFILDQNIPDIDEVVIQLDTTATEEVKEVCYKYPAFTLIEFPLNRDFATFKNNLKSKCNRDYIFFIDADEYPSFDLINNIHELLELNPDIELYAVPRINTVEGLTQEHIDQWGWRVSDNGWVNYPDHQTRLIQNKPEINWVGKVHERLLGAKIEIALPGGYDLIHPKDIERQERQNNFYDTL